MNKETEIRVKTPIGHTDYCNVGETLGQGTSESGIISATNLDVSVSILQIVEVKLTMLNFLFLVACIKMI